MERAMDAMEKLSNYDRATVGMWRRANAELTPPLKYLFPTWAAVHAVLAGLRRHHDAAALLAAYDSTPDNAADFALIRSLLPEVNSNPAYFQVREAAFYLRWREVSGMP